MSSLTEIEAAVEALPLQEQFILLRNPEAKVRERQTERATLVIENGRAILMASPDAPSMTPDLIRALRDDEA